jgi:hypothetical protein
MGEAVWFLIGLAMVLIALLIYWRPDRASVREIRFAKARRDFHIRREWLEAKFIQLAADQSKTRSPRWTDCTFADDVAYVRRRSTGEISALVAISIAADDSRIRSVTGGDAIGNLQLGTAIFRWDHDHWVTDGRAILNLGPADTIRRFQRDYQIIGEEYGMQG